MSTNTVKLLGLQLLCWAVLPLAAGASSLGTSPREAGFVAESRALTTIRGSGYFGGVHPDFITDVAVDAHGAIYVAGATSSADLPVTPNAVQGTAHSRSDYQAFLAKFSADGRQLLFSTYLGGTKDEGDAGSDIGFNRDASLALLQDGTVVLVCSTKSTDFPTTPDAVQGWNAGRSDVALAVIDSGTGRLVYSTYIGTSSIEYPLAVAVDRQNAVHIACWKQDSRNHLELVLYSFLDGVSGRPLVRQVVADRDDWATDLAISPAGDVYVCGITESSNFPGVGGSAVADTAQGDEAALLARTKKAFVLRFDRAGGGPKAAMSWPASVDAGFHEIAVLPSGEIAVCGYTKQDPDPGFGSKALLAVDKNMLVCVLEPGNLSVLHSRVIGGTADDFATGLTPDGDAIVLAGATKSCESFPFTEPLEGCAGQDEAIVMRLDKDLSGVEWSTPFGGAQDDLALRMTATSNGTVIVGETKSKDLPIVSALYDRNAGSWDGFLLVLDSEQPLGWQAVGVSPDTLGNAGDGTLTIRLQGSEFPVAATLQSATHSAQAFDLFRDSEQHQVMARFNCSPLAPGSYDLVLRSADPPRTQTLPGAVTVRTGTGPEIRVSLVGRPVIRHKREQIFEVVVENTGDADAVAVPLYISGGPVAFDMSVDHPGSAKGLAPLGDNWNPCAPGDAWCEEVRDMIINLIPPKEQRTVRVRVKTTEDDLCSTPAKRRLKWKMVAGPVGTTASDRELLRQCVAHGLLAGIHDLSEAMFGECGGAVANGYLDLFLGWWNSGEDVTEESSQITEEFEFSTTVGQCIEILKSCAVELGITILAPEVKAAQFLYRATKLLTKSGDLVDAYNACWPAIKMGIGDAVTSIVCALDPNDMAGPPGYGDENWIRPMGDATYCVNFENLAAATAPAQTITIDCRLDPTTLDIKELALQQLSLGERLLDLPRGAAAVDTVYDLSSEPPLMLHVSSRLDAGAGVLHVKLEARDPITGDLPEDPLLGILPPNANPPEGEGAITLRIPYRSNLTHGTGIEAQASIVFDENPPIQTPLWRNRVDADAPFSHLRDRPTMQDSSAVHLSWTGHDDGSGIGGYVLYVSEDGDEPRIWRHETPDTSAVFLGEYGKSYGFSCRAVDWTGQVEDKELAPQYTVRIVEPTMGATLDLSQPRGNPARGSTLLRGVVPNDQPAAVEVLDVTGRRIRQLWSGRGAGQMEWLWDTRNDRGEQVAAGLYFVRLSDNRHAVTRKLVVMR
jgi:hypothetical protein